MNDLVIFDLDGTLVNSIYDLADAVNDALAEFGYPLHNVSEYYYFVGNGTVKLCERALPPDKRDKDEIMRLHEKFAANYDKCCLNKTNAYDGIKDCLAELKTRGVKIAVASNKTDEFVNHIVSYIFGTDMFDYVVGKREGVPTKPDPQILDNIITAAGASKADCIMVGDSNVDVITAHNCGIKCIGCVWGFRGEKELTDAGADLIAHTPSDIVDFVV